MIVARGKVEKKRAPVLTERPAGECAYTSLALLAVNDWPTSSGLRKIERNGKRRKNNKTKEKGLFCFEEKIALEMKAS